MKLPQVIALPRQTLAIPRDLQPWTGRHALVGAPPRAPARMVSDTIFNKALRSLDFDGATHVHPGFRIAASATLNDLGWNRARIERHLAKTEGNKVRKACNQAHDLEGRAEVMHPYADWLDEQDKKFESRDKGQTESSFPVSSPSWPGPLLRSDWAS